jgi:glutaredoxin
MGEILTISHWQKILNKSEILILVTKKSCQDCIKVEKYLELNNYQLDGIEVRKISLDNPESEKLSDYLKWIKKEVDVIPFWTLMSNGERFSTIRGGIREARSLITSSQEHLFPED